MKPDKQKPGQFYNYKNCKGLLLGLKRQSREIMNAYRLPEV